jgi:hypothetical protein
MMMMMRGVRVMVTLLTGLLTFCWDILGGLQDGWAGSLIVLLLTVTKFGKGKYKIGRITQVFPDPHGLVRTTEVEMRPTSKEPGLPYRSKQLQT